MYLSSILENKSELITLGICGASWAAQWQGRGFSPRVVPAKKGHVGLLICHFIVELWIRRKRRGLESGGKKKVRERECKGWVGEVYEEGKRAQRRLRDGERRIRK